MAEKEPFERVPKTRPGDEVLRRRRRPRRRLRVAPRIPEIAVALRVILTETPFVPMISLVVVLWLLFSTGLYFAEHQADGSEIKHYSEALWWGVVAMTSMGTAPMPVTGVGQLVGAIWAVLGCILFYGTIIASVTVYFWRRRETPRTQVTATVQYNLGMLEELSIEELEALKETTVFLIDSRIGRLSGKP